jgi:hypothetical protein
MSHHPPKPRLALTLGVTGHRLTRAPAAGENDPAAPRPFDVAAVGKALEAAFAAAAAGLAAIGAEARASFSEVPPIMTLISSLAEGADRIAARAALEAGFALDVVLPCPAPIYAETFVDDASREEFASLSARARATLILPLAGDSAAPLDERLPATFEAAGLTTLAQSDILVAVWDGKPAEGRGGTGQVVEEAARRGAPIVVVDPKDGATRLLWADEQADEATARRTLDIAPRPLEPALAELIARIVGPPLAAEERAGLKQYFACRVGADASRRASLVFDGRDLEAPRAHWPRVSAAVGESATNRTAAKRYAQALLAAEDVAARHAGAYRRLFLASSAATVLASAFIAGAARFRELHLTAAAFELLTVALVGALVLFATRRRWHHQWFEARELAERLRVVAPAWLLGAWPSHLKPAQAAWPGWCARAVARELPLFAGEIGGLTDEIRDILTALVDEQLAYHVANAERLEQRDHVYEGIGVGLLAASLVNNAAYLGARFFDASGLESYESWGLAAAIFLPAAATAAYGVRLFGDYEDLARRSRRTAGELRALQARIVGALDLRALRGVAEAATRAMLSDLDAWRVAVESRRLSAS